MTSETALEAVRDKQSPPTVAERRAGPVILVVEDGEHMRYAIKRQLEKAGYQVLEASSAREALSVLESSTPPELMVLDIALPDADGMDLCRSLRARKATASLPVIQISARFTRGEDYARGLDSGADTYLIQPIEPPVLLSTVKSLLRARQAEMARARLAAIVENADEPIVSKDLQGVITSWNSAAERLFGYPAADAIGQGISLIIPEELREQEEEILRRIAAGERIEQLETVRVAKGGRRIDVLVTISPIRNGAGRITGASKIVRDITWRKRAEEALRVSETRLRTIIENLHEGLIVIDPDGVTLHWNRMALEMHGYTAHEEPLSIFSEVKNLYEVLTLERQPVPLEQWPIPRLLREGTLRNSELIIRHKHKQWERILNYGGVVLPAAGAVQPLGLLTIRDVTDQKHAEEALRRSEERYRCFVQASSQVVWVMNPAGQFEGDPQAWHAYTGQSLEQARGFGWLDAVRREDRQSVLDAWLKANESRTGYSVEYCLRRHDGAWRYIQARGVPVLGPDGTVREWIGTCTDVTEQKAAEQALVESEQRFRTLADNISQFAWMADGEGSLFWYNQRWFDYTGTTLERMQGWGWKAVHHPEHVDRVVRTFSESIATGRPWEDTFPLRGKDGTYRWFLSRALPIRDEQGKTVRWFGTNTDITERRQFQEELENLVAERTARLRETVADLEHFSYTITHDMRSPLRAMQGFGHMLELEYKDRLDDAGRDYLRRIIESSQRMDHLITDALNYAKVVRQELELRPVNAEALLRGMVDSYPEFQPPKAVVRIEGNIPPVLGNTAVLTQCFSNLLVNAVKFVRAGTMPQVNISSQRRGDCIHISVEDNGIGIRREDQQRIFSMFQRLSAEHEGTGIGLALVKKGVERMRGKVGVESAPGRGSRFWIELQAA